MADETVGAPEHEFYNPGRESDHGNSLDVVACRCGEWEWDSNDPQCENRWAQHVAEQTPKPHRIDIKDALDTYSGDVEVGVANEEDFLAVLYAWRDEAITDALRAAAGAVTRMSLAHTPRTNSEISPGVTICTGPMDPVTKESCQFAGPSTSHNAHLEERITVALDGVRGGDVNG